jgi:hypothetical protein
VDTRTKIVSAAALRGLGKPALAVAGYFDVLRAEHVRKLHELKETAGGRALAAIVLPCADALLPQQARAELAAGLRIIDYVVLWDARETPLAEALRPVEVIDFGPDDLRIAHKLREHVRHRQNS